MRLYLFHGFYIVLSLVSNGMFSVVASVICMVLESVSVLCFFLDSSVFAMASSVMRVYVLALYSASLFLMSLSVFGCGFGVYAV